MAGTFSKQSLPKRPGAYFNFVAGEQQPVLQPTIGTVAIPFVSDWGPGEQVVELTSLSDFLAKFGGISQFGATLTDGYKAVKQAFQGEGLPGRGGATMVLAFRMEGSDANQATKALQNTTPATAITLEARYTGSYGNRLQVTVEANAADPTNKHDLVILDNGVEVERFTYAKTDINALGADVRANSDWVDYTGAITSGVALALVSEQAFTTGDDGDTVIAADYTAAMTAFEAHRFSLFATYNTDSSIRASLVAWVQSLNSRGQRFMAVMGGAAGESASDAVTRSAAIDDPNVVNVGVGTYEDEQLGALSTAQLAARVAGILARRGEAESLTFARLAGLSITTGADVQDILDCIDGGVVTFARDSHPTAPVRIEKGVTAFVSTADANRPHNIYSVPKFVRTMHGIEMELTEWAEINVIGRLAITEGTRAFVRGHMESALRTRELQGIVQPGWTVQIDPTPAPSDTDDFIALLYSLKFGRSLEQVLNTVVVG